MQILISHLVMVLLVGIVMSAAVSSVFSLGHAIDRILEANFRSVLAAGQMRDALGSSQAAVGRRLAGQVDSFPSRTAAVRQVFEDGLEGATEAVNEPGEKEIVGRIGADWGVYQQAYAQFAAAPPGREGAIFAAAIDPTLSRLKYHISELEAMNRAAILRERDRAKELVQAAATRSVLATITALVLAIVLTVVVSRSLLRPLGTLAAKAQSIGAGNLEERINLPRKDEIGALATSFNTMAENLSQARHHEARRLQRAERMSDAALESLYDPVVVTDARGRIVHLNRAAEGLFGPAPATPRAPIIEHVGDRRIVRAIQNAVREERVSDSEDDTTLIPLKVGGMERTYRLRATPMKGVDGSMLGSVAVLEDITHLKELDRLKTEFISVASHELRTPVTSLLLSVQLLEEGAAGDLNDKQREIVAAQRVDLERLEKLMRELLDITRLEAGTSPPRLEVVPPHELMKAAYDSTRSQAEKKGVELTLAEDPDLQPVRADRSQIGRVLVNLISNGIRHTAPGGSLTVRASSAENGVTFRVEDTGEGIPKEYLDKIFDRFVQVPGATQGGAGLGLSIVQTIVQAHGGDMSVESELGKGSAFSFTLSSEPTHLGGEDKA
jgi:two-component system, NtrC family, sensor histidine kinase KinB